MGLEIVDESGGIDCGRVSRHIIIEGDLLVASRECSGEVGTGQLQLLSPAN